MSARPGYAEYMNSAAWAAKRQERLELDGHRCQTCGHDGSVFRLEVHHSSYARLGAESLGDLLTLCSSCHKAVTDAIRRQRYADRHVGIEFDDLVPDISTRVEVNYYGMADTKVSVDIIERHAPSQRADGKPVEQVGKVDEADFLQARQDRRRL